MILVEDLCKTFSAGPTGARPALDRVSFQARPGEVLGFLGQNGAGKTTTMRILAGFLRPSAGRASICGHDVVEDSLAARAHLGYLPEQVPLYPELRVHEYLAHRAELKGLPRRERRDAVATAIGQVGLRGQEQRIIGQLSKGYRQRVGLADALLHQPPVLILDEPTDGLDPNQRREVLALIASLARERAVVLSTHVLPEVEGVCHRLVILDRGRVVATGTPGEITRRLGPSALASAVGAGALVAVTARGPLPALLEALRAVPGVATVTSPSTGEADALHALQVLLAAPADTVMDEEAIGQVCEALAQAVMKVGALRQLAPERSSLDAVFRGLTQGEGSATSEVAP